MAHRTTLEAESTAKTPKVAKKPTAGGLAKGVSKEERERVFDAFRRWGYVEATLDPLGLFEPLKQPDLDRLTGEAAGEARRIYCGTLGADFMHLPEPERRRWIAERLEAPAGEVDRHKILERLIRADLFEQVLQARYLGTKRFSLEGVTALIPLLDSILDTAGEHGARESVDRKSTRLNSSHSQISYAVFCLKKNTTTTTTPRSSPPWPTASSPPRRTPSRSTLAVSAPSSMSSRANWSTMHMRRNVRSQARAT